MPENPYKSPEAEVPQDEPSHKRLGWIFTGDRFFDVATSIFLLTLLAITIATFALPAIR